MAMAQALAAKRRVRGGHKAVITRKLEEVKRITEADEPDLVKAEQLCRSLKDKLDTIKDSDEQIFVAIEDETELETAMINADETTSLIYEALVGLDNILATSGSTTGGIEEGGARASGPSRSCRARLPELNLKQFNGELTQWLPFWDTYHAAVHDNSDLSDIDKFTYLTTLLRGSARDAIKGLTLTSANYKEAVEILTKRFGDHQQIKGKHMEALLAMEPAQNNTQSLRRLFDEVESHVRQLKALGVSEEAYDTLLPSVLMNKLPSDMKLLITRGVSQKDWGLTKILSTFEEELKARERTSAKGKPAKEVPPSSSAFMTGNRHCCYCQLNHLPELCKKVSRVDGRRRILKEAGRCFICLRTGHISRNCRSSVRCSKCKGRHHLSICSKEGDEEGTGDNQQEAGEQSLNPRAPAFESKSTKSLLVDSDQTVLLQTARATCFNPDKPHIQLGLRFLLDSGSQRSFITKRAKDKLRLRTTDQKMMSIITFGATVTRSQKCDIVKLGVQTMEGSLEVMLFSVPSICEPLSGSSIQLCLENYKHLQGLELEDVSNLEGMVEPDVLIGSDCYWEFVSGEIIKGMRGPTASHTKLGWVLSGPLEGDENGQCSSMLITHNLITSAEPKDSTSLEKLLKGFWELESLGILEKENLIYDQLRSNISFHEGHYQVCLPWRDSVSHLPDNLRLCEKRLRSLVRRLKQSPDLLKDYNAVIKDQLARGIVETVENPSVVDGEKVHYLPHHAVVRRDKTTTKVRVVFDASARSNGPSLNNCLHVGPRFNQMILGILLRFRFHRHAFTADIEKAFLMVSVARKDRDVLRFLWIRNPDEEPPVTQVLRYARVVFGVNSSPFLLNATIRHHVEHYRDSDPLVVKSLLESIYVDDIIGGADTEEGVWKLYCDYKRILSEGGFNLRKYIASGSVIDTGVIDESYAKFSLGNSPERLTEQKVLGIRWKVEDALV
ncbi:PREDICTED: uncharacterized protein LOC105311847 [Amphimedon queenslandica]|uniref:CCHC-type domain-containing protein n=1 Tax=Amphimedon queenslandica TaxID=400682 RepID=A0A1X7TCS0_AMPQE|nr:PREDICTED: uncharacterized protein LOC105311847 [Amphimedon queenslandica]|eukprot:XP_011407795.1 PREDICTED: uncharacterized protein LOC105311847 [Amphimedon queenslandica]